MSLMEPGQWAVGAAELAARTQPFPEHSGSLWLGVEWEVSSWAEGLLTGEIPARCLAAACSRKSRDLLEMGICLNSWSS